MKFDNGLFTPVPGSERFNPQTDGSALVGVPNNLIKLRMFRKLPNGKWFSAMLPVDQNFNDGRGFRTYESMGWVLEAEYKRLVQMELDAEKALLAAAAKDQTETAEKTVVKTRGRKKKTETNVTEELDMNERENRDDLVKRMVDQFKQTKGGELSSQEKKQCEDYVKKTILPKVYEDRK